MNAVNDTCELTEAELDLVAGGAPTHYEMENGYTFRDLYADLYLTALDGAYPG